MDSWQPIETAPKHEQILMLTKHGAIEGQWDGEVGSGYYWQIIEWYATHWMPVPELPAEQSNPYKKTRNTNLEWASFPVEHFKTDRFDCSKAHLLNELSTRAEYWHRKTDGGYRLPKLGGQLTQILEMAIAAKLKD